MRYLLLAIILFLIFRLTQAWYYYRSLKSRITYQLEKTQFKLDNDPDNPLLYYERGTWFQNLQDFKRANQDFRKALHIIREGFPIENKANLESKILMNLHFTERPLPWSKSGPKNFSGNLFVFFLIERFGNQRYIS